MRTITLVLLLIGWLAGGCTENASDLLNLNPEGPIGPLYGRSWYNSHEAQLGDTVIYRPQGYIMPPNVPRYGPIFLDGMRFNQDGEFTLFTFGPADAPESYLGRWAPITEDHNTLLITLENAERQPPYQLRVLSVENDKLVIRRLP